MPITNRQRIAAVLAMIVAETSCREADLTDGRVHICQTRPEDRGLPAHRKFPAHPGTMCAVTLGTGAVIAADAEHIEWARQTYTGADRDGGFDPVRLGEAARHWLQFDRKLYGPFPRFSGSSETVRRVEVPTGCVLKVVGPEIAPLLDRSRWPNSSSARQIVFAVVAYEPGTPGELIGVASVTGDSDFLWQIGIDVAAGHQGRGVGAAMASLAALETLAQGRVPYWGATNSNVPSIRTALTIGLAPTYVEVLTRPAHRT